MIGGMSKRVGLASLALDGSGNGAVIWNSLGGWSEVTVFDADPAGDSAGARATVDTAGKATIVWHQLPPGNMAGSDILAAH